MLQGVAAKDMSSPLCIAWSWRGVMLTSPIVPSKRGPCSHKAASFDFACWPAARIDMGDALAIEEQRSVLSTRSVAPQPDTINKIVRRIKAMVTKLLPVEVDQSQIKDATSSIITPEVIAAFGKSGGDFGEAVPFW